MGIPPGDARSDTVDMGLVRSERADVTCIVADDHPPILDSVSRFLTDSGFNVVATARNGVEALALIEEMEPRVCLADVRMPLLDGMELARRLHDRAAAVSVLLYSGAADPTLVDAAFDVGAAGLAVKDAPLGDLARAVDTVASGALYVDPVLVAAVTRRDIDGSARSLTPREREVLRMLAVGGSYAEIGAQLFLAADTVRAHAAHAMDKLGARTRTHAVALALRDGLIA